MPAQDFEKEWQMLAMMLCTVLLFTVFVGLPQTEMEKRWIAVILMTAFIMGFVFSYTHAHGFYVGMSTLRKLQWSILSFIVLISYALILYTIYMREVRNLTQKAEVATTEGSTSTEEMWHTDSEIELNATQGYSGNNSAWVLNQIELINSL